MWGGTTSGEREAFALLHLGVGCWESSVLAASHGVEMKAFPTPSSTCTPGLFPPCFWGVLKAAPLAFPCGRGRPPHRGQPQWLVAIPTCVRRMGRPSPPRDDHDGFGVIICPHIQIFLMFGVIICPHIRIFPMDEDLGSLFIPTSRYF